MQLVRSTLEIGLEKPIKILHVTDSHVAYVDENPFQFIGQRKISL